MKPMLKTAKARLSEYGYSLDATGMIFSGEKSLGVVVSFKKDRFQARMGAGGILLWSGPDVGWFVEQFWFAKRVAG